MGSLSTLKTPLAAQWQDSVLAQRWRSLPPRDRLALGLLALFLGAVLLYLLLWQPAQQRLNSARVAFEQERALYAYLQEKAPLARRVSLKPQVNLDPARLQGLVTASAAEQGLAIERVDSDGDGSLQVSLQPAPFSQLLRWFTALQEQGVTISEAGLDRGEENRVSTRLTLRAGP
ncbi:type II secretion system protein M [Pseudomonas sp.]|uniref:type II secretion system protein M n=1 Tax=Pseudomonas sp. TaxID=306 RepID=UPI003D0D9979